MKNIFFILLIISTTATAQIRGNKTLTTKDKVKQNEITWINFKIKNNSNNRHHFIVKGPKADGSNFGYGFPMMPGEIRKEKWSVGTKVYEESKFGFRKLLVTIKEKDKSTIVNLFH